MKTTILSLALATAMSLSVRTVSADAKSNLRRTSVNSPAVNRATNLRGRYRVEYRMYGSQKKLFQNRALADRTVGYLTSLGAKAKSVQLGSRYLVSYNMRGSQGKSFTTYKLAQFFQQRVRSLGFHATISRR